MKIPEYITIKDQTGNVLAYLSPSADGLSDVWIDNRLNEQCTLTFELPLSSDKWQYITPSNRVYAGDREFVLCQPDDIEHKRDGRKRRGKVTAHESWKLLSRVFRTVSNDPQLPAPPDLTVAIISGGSNLSGGLYPVGSAAHALYALLQGTGWGLGTVDVTGTYDLEQEKVAVLGCIQKVQELWGGWLIWDSVNKTLSLRPDSWQNNSGFQIRYGKNQKSITRYIDHDVTTKLWAFGENDLDMLSVNTLHSGTAQGGGTNTITLATSANQVSGSYVRGVITLTGGTGAGQTRTIVAYDGTTRVATVDSPWTTQPAAGTTYSINGRFLLDFTYSTDLREGVFHDQEIVHPSYLLAKAQEVLSKSCKPRYNYRVSLVDMRTLPGWSHENFRIGDMVELIDEEMGIDSLVRVLRHKYNVFQPWLCELEVGDPVESLWKQMAGLAWTVREAYRLGRSPVTIVVADGATSKNTRRADLIVPAGSTSAQKVINTAIEMLPPNGGTVELAEGTYVVDDSIIVKSNLNIRGQSHNAVIKIKDNAPADFAVFKNKDVTPTSQGEAVTNLSITDIVIDGNKANNATRNAIGIAMWPVSLSEFNRLIIKNVPGPSTQYGHGILIAGASQCKFHQIEAFGCEGMGIFLTNASNNNVISNCIAHENAEVGIYVGPGVGLVDALGCNDNSIVGNTCYRNGNAGIFVTGGDADTYDKQSKRNSVTGNTCSENEDGILLGYRVYYNTISSNTCTRNGRTGILLFTSAKHNEIVGNIVEANSQQGHQQYCNIILQDDSDYNNIESNIVRRGDLANKPIYGIYIANTSCNGNRVTNNDLYTAGTSGGLLDSGSGTVTSAGNRT